MYKDKYTKELARHNDISLVMYVSEDDRGEHTQYVTCRWYDPTQPIGQQWDYGDYYNNIVDATEAYKVRAGVESKNDKGRIPRQRLEELANRLKDVLVDIFDFQKEDFSEGTYDLDMTEEEMNWFGIEEDEDESDDEEDWFDIEGNEDDDDDLMDGDLEDIFGNLLD